MVPSYGLGDEERGREAFSKALQAPTPSEVIGKVLGCDAVETSHPSFEPAVVGIDVLNMEGVVHNANTRTEIDRLVGNMGLFGKDAVDDIAVGTQNRSVLLIWGTDDTEVTENMIGTARELIPRVEFQPVEGAGHGFGNHRRQERSDSTHCTAYR